MLKDNTFFECTNKVQTALSRLSEYYHLTEGEGYYVAFSGGKDSIVIKKLVEMSGLPFDSHYNVTGIDPPEVVQFIRREHPDVKHDKNPKGTFFKLAVKRGFPLRQARWCCKELKEIGGAGRVVVTGIRWAESPRRKSQRKLLDNGNCEKIILNPIIDWTDEDVWEFIREYDLPYCKLYDEGWTRIGCLLCPFSSKNERRATMIKYPKVVNNFRRCFRRIYEYKQQRGLQGFYKSDIRYGNHIHCKTSVDRWKNGDEMFDWWIKTR